MYRTFNSASELSSFAMFGNETFIDAIRYFSRAVSSSSVTPGSEMIIYAIKPMTSTKLDYFADFIHVRLCIYVILMFWRIVSHIQVLTSVFMRQIVSKISDTCRIIEKFGGKNSFHKYAHNSNNCIIWWYSHSNPSLTVSKTLL